MAGQMSEPVQCLTDFSSTRECSGELGSARRPGDSNVGGCFSQETPPLHWGQLTGCLGSQPEGTREKRRVRCKREAPGRSA